MKKFFKEVKKLEYKHLRELAGFSAAMMILIFAAVFVSSSEIKNLHLTAHFKTSTQTAGFNVGCALGFSCGNDSQAYGLTSDISSVQSGGSVTLTWTSWYYQTTGNTYTGQCNENGDQTHSILITAPCSITPEVGSWGLTTALSGTFVVHPTVNPTTYTFCSYWFQSQGYGCPTVIVTVTVPDNCPAISTPSGAGLLVGPGVHNVVGAGQDFCVNNQTGNTYFVSTISSTDINTFKAAAQGYLSSSVSYFARTAGY
jgi:hypothetical protein